MHPLRHFLTVTRHRHLVMRLCARAGILLQGLRHDLSKYSPAEFIPGARYFQGNRSPNEREREARGYSAAWMHHMGRNKHHYEYWRDMDMATRRYAPVAMPVRYAAEMFCDRVAASKIYRGDSYRCEDPLLYFRRGNAKTAMHPDTAALLEGWLVLLASRGEGAALTEVKRAVREAKKSEKAKKRNCAKPE